VHKFGTLGQFETVETEFRVTNHFAETVEVLEVLKSCGYAGAEMVPRTLSPGESGTLRVVWKTGAKRGRVADTVMLSYAVRTPTGRATNILPIQVRANVLADVVFAPECIEFTADQPGRVVVQFRPGRPDKRFRLLTAYPSQSAFAASLDPDKAEVTVTYDPEKPGWDIPNLHLSVQTDNLREPRIAVPIRVRPAQSEAVGRDSRIKE
jgi:hypothetical protein